MNREQVLKELLEMERGPLMTRAREEGITNIPKKNNDELIEEVALKYPAQSPAAKVTSDRLSEALEKALKGTGDMVSFDRHQRRVMPGIEQAGPVMACFHEDLDEVQAHYMGQGLDLHQLKTVEPIAAVSLHGRRGIIRQAIMHRLCRALRSLGFEIRVEGATIY